MFFEKDTPLFNIFLEQIEVFTRQDLFLLNLLKMVKESLQASACSIRLLEQGKLSKGVCIGYTHEEKRNHSITIDKNIRLILHSSSPYYIADISKSDIIPKRRKDRYRDEGFKSCVFVPLRTDDRFNIGILSVYFSQKKLLNVQKQNNLQLIANMFAYILHKSILYEDVLELKQLIQNVVEFSADSILLTDEMGKIIYVSKQAARLFKKRVQSLIGEYIFQFDHSQESTMAKAIRQVRRRRSLVNFRVKIQLPNGQELFLLVSTTKLQLFRTDRQIYLWLIRDMTSLKNAELELNHKKEELEDFVYSVSHDLKSPIVSVQGYAALLKDDLYTTFNHTHRHYFDRVINNINLMQRMIQDLLELSRIGKLDTQITVESSGDLVKEALDEFYYQIEKRNIKILLPKRFPRIRCNRKSLALVFTNLIGNAIKFMGDVKHPSIELGFIRKTDEHIFFVRDNGIGINERDHEKIFHVFFRSQELKDVEGTGIGLTMVKKVIKYHGGSVWLESEPQIGSTFYFSIPKIIPEFKSQG